MIEVIKYWGNFEIVETVVAAVAVDSVNIGVLNWFHY